MLTAVDAAVMVIDAAKGVEAQTIKLFEVCRLRATPIITFINKIDREVREPLALLDEIETVLGDRLRAGDLADRHGQARFAACSTCARPPAALHARRGARAADDTELIEGLDNRASTRCFRDEIAALRHDVELLRGASAPFDLDEFLAGRQTPVFFGSGINNFGVQEILQALIEWAPPPQPRDGGTRVVAPAEAPFTRLRVQDPGEHGPAAPRPHRVLPRVLRPVRAGHEGAPPAPRPRDEARPTR